MKKRGRKFVFMFWVALLIFIFIAVLIGLRFTGFSIADLFELSSNYPQNYDSSRVLIVQNTAYPDNDGNGISDSVDIAEYYRQARNIPQDNICSVSMSQVLYFRYNDISEKFRS